MFSCFRLDDLLDPSTELAIRAEKLYSNMYGSAALGAMMGMIGGLLIFAIPYVLRLRSTRSDSETSTTEQASDLDSSSSDITLGNLHREWRNEDVSEVLGTEGILDRRSSSLNISLADIGYGTRDAAIPAPYLPNIPSTSIDKDWIHQIGSEEQQHQTGDGAAR